ncbi:hypothetical protein BDV26DRAFT_299346 [Aspergillus bertholletiae]|uniref:Cyclase-domain-containing protein n=1 Tax=Aspergillus bertholletiae TaxID=1226010 RepID=A0A5N7BQL3_9EURO|nr:hypothetical protein BDV26DRAFT_299346 [Aspergillus bertholletiae]
MKGFRCFYCWMKSLFLFNYFYRKALSTKMSSSNVRQFNELPFRPGDPPYSAWGMWEKKHLGSLNYLDDQMVLKAATEEIRIGQRVLLNLPLDNFDPPLLGRQAFERRIIDKAPKVINDDVITFNTQGSSQWDSFRHFAYQGHAQFYNGVTQDDIHGDSCSTAGACSSWEGGIAGRGVLVDYYSWALKNEVNYNAVGTHACQLDQIKQILSEQNTSLQPGDILFLRTGYVAEYSKLDGAGREAVSKNANFPGLHQSRETTEWLWEHQFAAVAADSPAFECAPPADADWMLHPILLSGWGTPIGELFDLEQLAGICKRLNRWSFFLTSSPLNYTGSVATPPNAMAIF